MPSLVPAGQCSSQVVICEPQMSYSTPQGEKPEPVCSINDCTSYTTCECKTGNISDPNIYLCNTQRAADDIDKYDWTPVRRGQLILHEHIQKLREFINAEEVLRFKNKTNFNASEIESSKKITSSQFNELRLIVNKLLSSGIIETNDAKYPLSNDFQTNIRIEDNYRVGMIIKAFDINELAQRINWISRQCYCREKMNCACHGNYEECACDAKYSACNGQCNCKSGFCKCDVVTCACLNGKCDCQTGQCGPNCNDCRNHNACPSNCSSDGGGCTGQCGSQSPTCDTQSTCTSQSDQCTNDCANQCNSHCASHGGCTSDSTPPDPTPTTKMMYYSLNITKPILVLNGLGNTVTNMYKRKTWAECTVSYTVNGTSAGPGDVIILVPNNSVNCTLEGNKIIVWLAKGPPYDKGTHKLSCHFDIYQYKSDGNLGLKRVKDKSGTVHLKFHIYDGNMSSGDVEVSSSSSLPYNKTWSVEIRA